MPLFTKILVPTDFSRHADEALRFALELAKPHGAALSIAHVYDVLPYTLPEGLPMIDELQMTQLRDAFQKQLDVIKQRLVASGAKNVETLLLQGPASSEIVRVAAERNFDLIVMGTHGRSGIAHLLLGSVAEKVVRKAPCAVMTVPLRDKSEK